MRRSKSDIMWGFLMIAPAIIGLIVLNIIPFFNSIFMSFMEHDGLSEPIFIGLDNYERMIKSKEVFGSIGNTLWYAFLSVPGGVFLGLVVAVLLNGKIKGKGLFRTIFFSPMVVAPAAVAMIWRWLFNTDFGILNYILSMVGIDKIKWLTIPEMVIPSLAIVTIWSTMGHNLIILLAGLQGIPDYYYEAASIDGAGPFKKFFSITIPLVSPMLFFVLVTSTMSAIKQFDLFYVMLGASSPVASKTQTLLYLFYNYAFRMNERGYASVIVIMAFVILLLITAFQFWYQKKWVHYE